MNIWFATGWLLILITWWSGSPSVLTRTDSSVSTTTGETCGLNENWQIGDSATNSQSIVNSPSDITLSSEGQMAFARVAFKDCHLGLEQRYRIRASIERLSPLVWINDRPKQTMFFIKSRSPDDQLQHTAVHRWIGLWPLNKIDEIAVLGPGNIDPAIRFLVRSPGSWRISQLKVEPVTMQPWATFVLPTLLIIWLGWVLVGAQGLLHHNKSRSSLGFTRLCVALAIGCVLFMTAAALLSPSQWLAIVKPYFTLTADRVGNMPAIVSSNDIAHVVGFVLFSVIVVGFARLSRKPMVFALSLIHI